VRRVKSSTKKYFRVADVVETCDVSVEFIRALEQEHVIKSVRRRRLKCYPLDQVDRIRVAHVLVGEMGVNLAGVEVALHMREQLISMRRELSLLLRRLGHSA
jgi:MerR family transcriptional regulator, heat shock protein HspR